MVVRERSRRGRTPLASGVLLSVFAACFNPQGTDTTGGPDTTGGSTTASTTGVTEPTGGLTSASSGGMTTTPNTATSDPSSTSTVTTAVTSSATGSTTEGGCMVNEDCPGNAPLCQNGMCVQCVENADCVDPAVPVCDQQGFTCRKCQFHSECELACDIEVGQCFPPETLDLLVTPMGNCGECNENVACCSITKAAAYASTQAVSHVRIRLNSAVPEPLTADLKVNLSNKVVAIVADAAAATLQPMAGMAIDLDQTAAAQSPRIYLWKLALAGNAGTGGILCRSAVLWLDDVRIGGNGGAALSTDDCTVKVRNSYLLGNTNNISTIGGAVDLHNVIVGLSPTVPEITIGMGTVFKARYSTIVDEEGGVNNLVQCNAAADADFDNSILVAKGVNPEHIAGCNAVLKVSNSVVSANFPWIEGSGNSIADLKQLAFGVNYLLTDASTVAEGVAVWSAIDLPRDIDGDPRPNFEGMQDWAGADIPK